MKTLWFWARTYLVFWSRKVGTTTNFSLFVHSFVHSLLQTYIECDPYVLGFVLETEKKAWDTSGQKPLVTKNDMLSVFCGGRSGCCGRFEGLCYGYWVLEPGTHWKGLWRELFSRGIVLVRGQCRQRTSQAEEQHSFVLGLTCSSSLRTSYLCWYGSYALDAVCREELFVMLLCSSHSVHWTKRQHLCLSNIYRSSKSLGVFQKGKEVSERFFL